MTHNLSPQTMELWATKYIAHDIWAQRALDRGLAVTGNVLRDQDLVTEQEFRDSTMYREFLAPVGIGRLVTGVVFSGKDNRQMPVICTCHRPFATPFTESDARKLQLLLPHLSRALGVMFRLRDAEFRVASSLDAPDRLPTGLLLFDAEGGVPFANAAARKILAQEDGLRLRNRPGLQEVSDLLAWHPQLQDTLDAAIDEAIAPDILTTRHFAKAIGIPRPSGKTPFTLNFSSLPQQNEFGLGPDIPRAIAFLSDNAMPVRLNAGLLMATYGLTHAEIRLAELMVHGQSLEDASAELGVSVNTVKTQLAQIYGKTNTNNRAKLVKLLIALADQGSL